MSLFGSIGKLKWIIEWRKGSKAVEKGLWSDAIMHLNAAIALKPGDAQSYFNRGLAFGGMGDLDNAIKDFNQVRRLDPNDRAAYNNLGTCYLRKNQIATALKHFKLALKLDPNDVQAQLNVGITYSKKAELADPKVKAKLFKLASGSLDQVINRDPNFPEAYQEKGALDHQMGQYEEAIINFTKAIDLDDSYAEAYYSRSLAKKELGYEKAAKRDLKTARELGFTG